ncbi:hypothetical protein TcWFU_007275 [Taenia crassiceps]|uniref:Uncharacterized protein n=1 Tax=Taenia crassiceps TaxID=6207 RepID=A0ABR4QM20_9CEST
MAGNVLNIGLLTSATLPLPRATVAHWRCTTSFTVSPVCPTLRTCQSLKMSSAYISALTYLLPLGNVWSNTTTVLIRSRTVSSILRTQRKVVFISLPIAIITLPNFFGQKIREARRKCSHFHLDELLRGYILRL